jgi:hypothetical protein
VALVVAALVFGACATVQPPADVARPHRERARTLERDGQLRAALLVW